LSAFIANIFTFPTVFYSGLLFFVVLYWLIAGFGILDIDALDGDVDFETGEQAAGSAGLLSKFKLEGIPLTISISFTVLASWVLSFLAVYFLFPLLPAGWIQIAVGFWILLLAPILAINIIAPLLKPLRPLFESLPEKKAADIVGQYAVVRSGTVTATTGEAMFQDGGAGLILKIRTDESNTIKRGDSVRLSRYDEVTGIYHVQATKSP